MHLHVCAHCPHIKINHKYINLSISTIYKELSVKSEATIKVTNTAKNSWTHK